MRLGLVTDFYYPWIGGPSAVVRNLGHGLSARGHSVFLLAPSVDGTATAEMDGPVHVTRARTVPVPFGYRMRTALPTRSNAIAWMRMVQPDVLNVHHPFPLSATAVAAARKADIPVVATNHTIPECSLWGIRNTGPLYEAAHWGFSRWLTFLLERCSVVATPTVTAADALKNLGYRGRVEAISNGIDTERFRPGQKSLTLRQRLGIDDRPVVLYTGRLDAEKQMDMWFDAAHALSQCVDAQFLVGGKGTERQRLERQVNTLGLRDRVRFFGYLADDEFPDIYRLADVFFIASPVELQSIATLEAAASGLPIVAVRAAALPELVHEHRNGMLIQPGNAVQAAEVLGNLLTNAGARARMGRYSRELAAHHSLASTIDRYEDLLTTAIRQNGGRAAA